MVRLITGDECGLLKEFVPEIAHRRQAKEEAASTKSDIIKPVCMDVTKINNAHGMQRIDPNESQSRSRGVVDLAMLSFGCDASFEFAALRANGSVETWKATANTDHTMPSSKRFVASYHRLGLTGSVFYAEQQRQQQAGELSTLLPPARPLALHSLMGKGRLCLCDTHGKIGVLQGDDEGVPQLLHTFDAYNNTSDNTFVTYTKGKVPNTQLATAMAVSASGRVAVGGRERDVRIFDLESSYANTTASSASRKPIWKAKNLPPDPQTLLQQPIWPSAIQFLDSDDDNNNSCNHLLAVGTAFGQLRIYDTRTNHDASIITRRPIQYTPEDLLEHRITAVCQIDAHSMVVGDTTGDIHTLDVRYNLTGNVNYKHKQDTATASLGRYVGPAGSVRQLVKHATLPLLATVSYDRMLRTYNTNTRKMIDCVYLKQRLNCVLLTNEGSWDRPKQETMDVFGGQGGDDHDDTNNNDVHQEDVVEDYVDSSSEGDDDGDEKDGDDNNSSSDEDSDDNGNQNEAPAPSANNNNPEKQDVSESGSESSAGSDEDSDESEPDEDLPKKRQRR